MKKRNLFHLFIRRFVSAFLVTLLLVSVAFISYKVTKVYYRITDVPTTGKLDTVIKDIVNDVQLDEISKNLIYSVEEETGVIQNIILEIFNSETGNLDYITIPDNLQFTISNELYQRLCVVNPDIPQIIKISDIGSYFKKDQVYNYGIIIIEDLFDVDISYYTAIKSGEFNGVFEPMEKSVLMWSGQGQVYTILKFTEDFHTKISRLKSEEDIKEMIKDSYKSIDSNLTLKNKFKYLSAYQLIRPEYIYYHGIYGVSNGSSFDPDVEASNEEIHKIINQAVYTNTQREELAKVANVIESSMDSKIQVLNASNIAGLAGKYRNSLTDLGFTITGIGNYPEETLTKTRIITRTGAIGLDLLNNFKDPQIENGELPDGIDITIILGTEDDING